MNAMKKIFSYSLIIILLFYAGAQNVFAQTSDAALTSGADATPVPPVPGFPNVGVAPSGASTAENPNADSIVWEILGGALVILVGYFFLKKNKKP